jgi:hypothetical protein
MMNSIQSKKKRSKLELVLDKFIFLSFATMVSIKFKVSLCLISSILSILWLDETDETFL